MEPSFYQALGNLYGLIPMGKVRELFEVEPDDCPAAMRYRNLVVHPLVPRGEITLLEKQQEQHPWYRPTLAQLAWYADPLYYDETPESKVFQRYLRDRFSLTGTRSRYCLGVFSGYVRRGRGWTTLRRSSICWSSRPFLTTRCRTCFRSPFLSTTIAACGQTGDIPRKKSWKCVPVHKISPHGKRRMTYTYGKGRNVFHAVYWID